MVISALPIGQVRSKDSAVECPANASPEGRHDHDLCQGMHGVNLLQVTDYLGFPGGVVVKNLP